MSVPSKNHALLALTVEEPLEPTDIEGFRKLRPHVKTLIATGEREWTPLGFGKIIDSGIVDVVGCDPGRAEGITGTRKVIELVEAAVRMILGGAKLIATNLDPNCPTQDGVRPGCGAMVAMLELATGIRAFSVGKPSPIMMRAARKELGLRTEETIMIGDTMETDILGAVQLGFHSILTLSGGTRREDLPHYAYGPELIVSSVAELNRIKREPGKNIMLIGSATLARSLLRDRVVDELVLIVYPLVAGEGRRLFEGGHDRIPLALTDTHVYGNGVVKLVYTPTSR